MLPLSEVSASELKTPVRPMNCASRMILLEGTRPREPDCCPVGPCPWGTLSERAPRFMGRVRARPACVRRGTDPPNGACKLSKERVQCHASTREPC